MKVRGSLQIMSYNFYQKEFEGKIFFINFSNRHRIKDFKFIFERQPSTPSTLIEDATFEYPLIMNAQESFFHVFFLPLSIFNGFFLTEFSDFQKFSVHRYGNVFLVLILKLSQKKVKN